MTTQRFSVESEGGAIFRCTPMKDIQQVQKAGLFFDCTLITGEGSIACHRAVLGASSKVLRRLLTPKDGEDVKHLCFSFPLSAIKQMVEFMYSGEFCVNKLTLKECIRVAHYLQFDDLLAHLVENAEDQMTPENVLGWDAFAQTFPLKTLLAKAKSITKMEMLKISESDEFEGLPEQKLVEHISQCDDADVAVTAALRWIKRDPDQRFSKSELIFHRIPLRHCSPSSLLSIVISLDEFYQRQTTSAPISLMKRLALAAIATTRKKAIVIAGGYYVGIDEKSWIPNTSCFELDGERGTFNLITKLPARTMGHSICAIPDGFMVTGGVCSDGSCNYLGDTGSVEEIRYDGTQVAVYSSVFQTWTQEPPMPLPYSFHASVYHNGFVYVIGHESFSVDVYSLEQRTWKKGTVLPEAMFTPRAAVLNGSIYVIGRTSLA
eukprot:GHVN01069069.1.p1 GENE.GHVN01069069.1~~GHVN01069069.1.p1  ORF type:complete len:434 (+),score=34.87 GHVN01069069.1:92-1393(+)